MVSCGGSFWTRVCNAPGKLKRDLSRSATKLPFAALAAQRLTSGGYAQKADFAKFNERPKTW